MAVDAVSYKLFINYVIGDINVKNVKMSAVIPLATLALISVIIVLTKIILSREVRAQLLTGGSHKLLCNF